MRREHKAFLVALRHELLTQPTDGNCSPRFWGIKETERMFGFDEEAGEGWEVYDGESVCKVGEPDDVDSVINEFVEEYGFDLSDFDEEHDEFYPIDRTDIRDVVERANQIAAKSAGWSGYSPYSVEYYQEKRKINRDAVFLTKRACLEHIKRYRYRYNSPHSYVMTAVDCPEYEKLLEILQETEWDKLEDDDETD